MKKVTVTVMFVFAFFFDRGMRKFTLAVMLLDSCMFTIVLVAMFADILAVIIEVLLTVIRTIILIIILAVIMAQLRKYSYYDSYIIVL